MWISWDTSLTVVASLTNVRARSARRNVSPDLPNLSPTVRSNPAQTYPKPAVCSAALGFGAGRLRPMSHQFSALLRIPLLLPPSLLPLRFSPLTSFTHATMPSSTQSNKENPPVSKGKKAIWTDADDKALLDCLLEQQAAGNQGDNGWKTLVWTAAEESLKGSEERSKGSRKTATSCRDRFKSVRT